MVFDTTPTLLSCKRNDALDAYEHFEPVVKKAVLDAFKEHPDLSSARWGYIRKNALDPIYDAMGNYLNYHKEFLLELYKFVDRAHEQNRERNEAGVIENIDEVLACYRREAEKCFT